MTCMHTIWLNSTMICICTILQEYLNIYFLNLIYGTKLDALILCIEINGPWALFQNMDTFEEE